MQRIGCAVHDPKLQGVGILIAEPSWFHHKHVVAEKRQQKWKWKRSDSDKQHSTALENIHTPTTPKWQWLLPQVLTPSWGILLPLRNGNNLPHSPHTNMRSLQPKSTVQNGQESSDNCQSSDKEGLLDGPSRPHSFSHDAQTVDARGQEFLNEVSEQDVLTLFQKCKQGRALKPNVSGKGAHSTPNASISQDPLCLFVNADVLRDKEKRCQWYHPSKFFANEKACKWYITPLHLMYWTTHSEHRSVLWSLSAKEGHYLLQHLWSS